MPPRRGDPPCKTFHSSPSGSVETVTLPGKIGTSAPPTASDGFGIMRLDIGDKNDSSWSLRPGLLVKHFGIAVEERRVPVGRGPTAAHRGYSDNGLAPCLHEDDGFRVWDSLAFAETLAERHPGL